MVEEAVCLLMERNWGVKEGLGSGWDRQGLLPVVYFPWVQVLLLKSFQSSKIVPPASDNMFTDYSVGNIQSHTHVGTQSHNRLENISIHMRTDPQAYPHTFT